MKALYELIELLPKSFTPNYQNRVNELFYFLKKEGKRLSKEEAAKKFLNSTKRDKYFNELKVKLKKALTRYLITTPSSADSKKAMIENCYCQFATYKILLVNGKRTAAMEIATTLLTKLREIEYYPLLYAVARDLLFHHSHGKPNLVLAKKYEAMVERYDAILVAETQVHLYYNRVVAICNTKEGITARELEFFKEAMEATLPLLQLGSYTLNRYIYNIAVSRHSAACEYKQALVYCNEALESVPEKHPNYRSLQFSFLHKKVTILLGMGNVDEAKEVARLTCEAVSTGGNNWHLALIKRVIVYFHSGDYQEAYGLYRASKKYPPKKENIIEYWKILEGYLYFLIQRGYIEPYAKERFYLGKFLNEVPLYFRDKTGQNINILIIQILVQMHQDKYGQIIDRTESLKAYVRSYTRNPQTKRANIFITMILKMESAQFHCSGTQIKTKKLAEQLAATPIKHGQNIAIEMIPYEVLWEEILIMLANKFRTTRGEKIRPKR